MSATKNRKEKVTSDKYEVPSISQAAPLKIEELTTASIPEVNTKATLMYEQRDLVDAGKEEKDLGRQLLIFGILAFGIIVLLTVGLIIIYLNLS